VHREAQARIDLAALRHNLARVRALAPHSRVMAVVKADAYGHGLARCATALEQADACAVGHVIEGQALRAAGCNAPIVVLEGFFDAAGLEACLRHGLQPVLHQPYQVEVLGQHLYGRPISLWLKFDSGMHRLGFPAVQAADWLARVQAMPGVAAPVGVMSHLACADDPADPRTAAQQARFLAATAAHAGPRSLANSAGVLAHAGTHLDWVRPGLMLYGVSPLLGSSAAAHGLRPVMTLSTRLIAVQDFAGGEAVGYSGAFVCPRGMRVGVAAIGYGDGYPRHAVSGTPVLVNGVRCALVGRVSMDMITLDLSAAPQARPGDRVILWGDGLPVEEVAASAGTISYELLCAVAGRMQFTAA
jgi:alanine racemase